MMAEGRGIEPLSPCGKPRLSKPVQYRSASLPALVILALIWSSPLRAQEPVTKWADYTSWATAGGNAAWGVVDAWKSERRGCHLGQMAISGLVSGGGAYLGQRFITSPRPCCSGNGMPSMHAALSVVGINQPTRANRFSLRFGVGVMLSGSTAGLRVAANRHTGPQVIAGLGLGALGEFAGSLLGCDE